MSNRISGMGTEELERLQKQINKRRDKLEEEACILLFEAMTRQTISFLLQILYGRKSHFYIHPSLCKLYLKNITFYNSHIELLCQMRFFH